MNWIDIVIGVPLIWAGYQGFKKGFVLEIFGLLALFTGIYGAVHFSDFTAEWLRNYFEMKDKYLPALSFTITFIGVIIAVHFIGKAIEKVVNIAAMKLANKLAGLLFSVLKVGLIMSIVLNLLLPMNREAKLVPLDGLDASLLFPPAQAFAPTVIPAVKESNFYKSLNAGKLEHLKDDVLDKLNGD